MPTRILRDGINSSARINRLSPGAEILYRRLMSVADDYGRYYASPVAIRGACWPTHFAPPCEQDVSRLLAECTQGDKPLITTYVVDGCSYLQLNDFNQKIRSKSKFPHNPGDLSADCRQIVDKMPALDVVEGVVGDGVEGACVRGAVAPSVRAVLPTLRKPNVTDLNGITSQRFDEFWDRYPRQQHRDAACHQWLSVVTIEVEPVLFACLQRYLDSDEVFRGAVANPEKWLLEQHRDRWQGNWPRHTNGSQKKTAIQSALEKAREEDKRNGIPYEGD